MYNHQVSDRHLREPGNRRSTIIAASEADLQRLRGRLRRGPTIQTGCRFGRPRRPYAWRLLGLRPIGRFRDVRTSFQRQSSGWMSRPADGQWTCQRYPNVTPMRLAKPNSVAAATAQHVECRQTFSGPAISRRLAGQTSPQLKRTSSPPSPPFIVSAAMAQSYRYQAKISIADPQRQAAMTEIDSAVTSTLTGPRYLCTTPRGQRAANRRSVSPVRRAPQSGEPKSGRLNGNLPSPLRAVTFAVSSTCGTMITFGAIQRSDGWSRRRGSVLGVDSLTVF